ncbi:MAG: hypothetical protein J0M35_15310 [Candidatus Obscuribacter phosphatis]|uniref:Uncharacterized protein n=1 Tax=Candidatus Obscuribacter phosphatis TaxID=1906157 RepID=A0A8J7PHC4_9BACT|nr:hypothetical protein [Candidatus Obscuribacter phosphatis]
MKKIRLKEGLPERKFALRKVCFKKSSIVEERAVRTIHSDDDSLWEKPLLLRAPEVAASYATLVPFMAYRPHAEAAPYAVSVLRAVFAAHGRCAAQSSCTVQE